MNEKRYVDFMSRIKASDSAVEKAVEGIYLSGAEQKNSCHTPKIWRCFRVAVTASVLCFILLAGLILNPFDSEKENVLFINAGAAEINTFEPIKLGELKCEFNSFGVAFNEKNEATHIAMLEWLEFPITCSGADIETITYTAKGKMFFHLSNNATMIYDKQCMEPSDVMLLFPYRSIGSMGYEYEEKLSSFTTNSIGQNQKILLCLYISEENGPYCKKYNSVTNNDMLELDDRFDYQQMYYELFNDGGYSVEITVKFGNGSVQTKVLDLVVEKTAKENNSKYNSSLVISAKLAQ